MIKTNDDRIGRRRIVDYLNKASSAEVDRATVGRSIDHAVLVYVRQQVERGRAGDLDARHVRTYARSPPDRVVSSSLEGDLEFLRDILPPEVLCRVTERKQGESRQDCQDHEHNYYLDKRISELRIVSAVGHKLSPAESECQWRGWADGKIFPSKVLA